LFGDPAEARSVHAVVMTAGMMPPDAPPHIAQKEKFLDDAGALQVGSWFGSASITGDDRATEFIIQANAKEIEGEELMWRQHRRRRSIGRKGSVAEIDMAIFELRRPIWREHR
jgi:hypothetical protein